MGWLHRGVCHATTTDFAAAYKVDYPIFSSGSIYHQPTSFAFYSEGTAGQYVEFKTTWRAGGTGTTPGTSGVQFWRHGVELCTPSSASSSGVFDDVPVQDVVVYLALAFAFVVGIAAGKLR